MESATQGLKTISMNVLKYYIILFGQKLVLKKNLPLPWTQPVDLD